ncbi:hypothetical protein YC2023_072185 [Brassica napus]
MDCSGFGPMVRVRAGGGTWGSGHEAMDRWGLGQGRGLSPEGLGKALGLCPTQSHAVLAKGRMRPRGCNPWPIVPIRWPVMPVRGARLTPSFSINMGSSLSISIIQFQSKILRKIIEREKERKREFQAKARPIVWWLGFRRSDRL